MNAIKFIQDNGVEKARGVVECAPEGAEFYHKDNNEYVKNIDQEHLEKAQAEPKESHLVNFDSSSSEGWVENAAWIEYINVLIDISDLKRLVESLDLVNNCGGLAIANKITFQKRLRNEKATHFIQHPENQKLIQLLGRNQRKPKEAIKFDLFEQAIRDHESIYGGSHE